MSSAKGSRRNRAIRLNAEHFTVERVNRFAIVQSPAGENAASQRVRFPLAIHWPTRMRPMG